MPLLHLLAAAALVQASAQEAPADPAPAPQEEAAEPQQPSPEAPPAEPVPPVDRPARRLDLGSVVGLVLAIMAGLDVLIAVATRRSRG